MDKQPPPQPLSFTFIEKSMHAYRFFWENRHRVLNMSMTPVAIKIFSFVVLLALGLEDNYLRQGLLLLPTYFAEGFLMAQLIRFAIFKEDLASFLKMKRDVDIERLEPQIREPVRYILGSTIIYVLLKLFTTLFIGMFFIQKAKMEETMTEEAANASPDAIAYFVSFFALLFMIWVFRFFWIYVPVAMGISMETFLHRIKNFTSSLYMIGAWILCLIPGIVVFILFATIIHDLTGTTGNPEQLSSYLFIILLATIEIAVVALSSVAMAFGVKSLFENK